MTEAEGAARAETTFKYRLRSPMGGLAADLVAATLSAAGRAPSHALRIHRALWLCCPGEGIYWKDAAWLAFGVSLHAEALTDRFPQGLIVDVHALRAPPSDYRSEVAALAMDGWLRAAFGLPGSGVGVEFDLAKGEYVFAWGAIETPFADPF